MCTYQVVLDKVSNDTIILSNGLISRSFLLSQPGFGTIDYCSTTTSNSILRTILPEAHVTLDGTEYPIGGLIEEDTQHSYLNRSSLKLSLLPKSFRYSAYLTTKPDARFPWTPGNRHSPPDSRWPPEGLRLTVIFSPPDDVAQPSHANIQVSIHYEMYQGAPILAKWLTVKNSGTSPVRVDAVTIENLGTQKPYAPLDLSPLPNPWENEGTQTTTSWLYVESDTPHVADLSWGVDPKASTSPGADEPLFTATYLVGPGVMLANTSGNEREATYPIVPSFETFRVLELVTDSNDRERVAMSRHQLIRLLAPHTQENPIFFHGTNYSTEGVKASIDQMAEVGFEMYIFSFGVGFIMEDIREEAIKSVADKVAYANARGIEVGG